MILSLYIKDYIIIDELNLDFKNGFSAFTGETGAGKSIIIDAIALLCGERLNHNVVYLNKEKAYIEAVLNVENLEAKSLLEEHGFSIEDSITLSREITPDTKSVMRLNGRVITQSFAKELTEHVIDIHNQFGTQYLLNKKNHLKLLDRFIGENEKLDIVLSKYREYDEKKKALENALKNEYNLEDRDYLEFQKNEIEAIETYDQEYEELEEKERRMNSFEKTSKSLSSALSSFDQSLDVFYAANKVLSELQEKDIESQSTGLNDLYFDYLDKVESLKDYYSSLSFDEREYNLIQERIFELNKIRRKYGKYDEMMKKYQEICSKIEQIDHREEFILQASEEVQIALDIYQKEAIQLSNIRKERSKELTNIITKELMDLELTKTKFEISFKEKEPSKDGIDDIEFLISTNPGMPTSSLIQIASGGELSRIMLALKTIFNRLEGLETVIFDEIDSGVSGSIATSIGKKMKQISTYSQVFSVTHLAQVAACANQHYFVSKSSKNDETTSKVTLLNDEERISELAMISNSTTSEAALKAAKELLLANQ